MEFKVKIRVKIYTQEFNSRGIIIGLNTRNWINICRKILINVVIVADDIYILVNVGSRKNNKFSFVRMQHQFISSKKFTDFLKFSVGSSRKNVNVVV